jgi:hypothetical protein
LSEAPGVGPLVELLLYVCCTRAQWNADDAKLSSSLRTLHPPRPSGRHPHRPLIFLIETRGTQTLRPKVVPNGAQTSEKQKRRGRTLVRPLAKPLRGHTRGWTPTPEWKRGLVRAPFSELTPQNRPLSRGSEPATPGSQSLRLNEIVQESCHALLPGEMTCWKLKPEELGRGYSLGQRGRLQILTEKAKFPTFFGSQSARGLSQVGVSGPEKPGSQQLLCADRGAEGLGKGLREALNVGMVLRFDHDAGELLGSRIAENDAAIFA